MTNKPTMILIAGPYRSGTTDDPKKFKANVHFMESFADEISTDSLLQDAVVRRLERFEEACGRVSPKNQENNLPFPGGQ